MTSNTDSSKNNRSLMSINSDYPIRDNRKNNRSQLKRNYMNVLNGIMTLEVIFL
jgi:hypothetical protein